MKRKHRIALGLITSAILGTVAWTNESIDYASKLGFNNINPQYAFIVSAVLFIIALVLTVMEIGKSK